MSGSTEHTTIGKKLINTSTLPLWAYEAEISGVTAQNDYREGNVLSYVYENLKKWEDEVEAMERWNKLSRQELITQHGYTENANGGLTPPPVAPTNTNIQNQILPDTNCANKNPGFENRGIPYKNPLGQTTCISSPYGPRTLFGRKFHYGIDLRATTGTPVYAPAYGKVVSVFTQNKSCGNGVVIEHTNGYSTKYCHFDSVAVKQGDKVSAGCMIGKVGNTGQSTGPHLHYSVLKDGNAVNPADFVEPECKSCY